MIGRLIPDRLKPGLQLLAACTERGWSPGFSLSVDHDELLIVLFRRFSFSLDVRWPDGKLLSVCQRPR